MHQTRPKRRGFIALVIIVAFLLAIGGYFFYNHEKNIIRRETYTLLKAIAALKIDQIRQWHNDLLSDARLYSTGSLKGEIFKWLKNADVDSKSALLIRLHEIRDNKNYDNLILAAPDGRILLSANPFFNEITPSDLELFNQVIAARTPVIGDFFIYQNQEKICLDTAALILDPENKPLALLILRTNPLSNPYFLIQSWPTTSGSAETLLVRKEGEHVLFITQTRHQQSPGLTMRIPLFSTHIPAVQAVLGSSGFFEGQDYRGVKVLADIRPVPGTPWFMVTKIDQAEILAEVRFRGLAILALVLLAILMTAALGALLYKSRQKNLYRNLLQAEQEKHAAQEEIRTTLYSIGDGVIVTDPVGRVMRMNPVAEQLTGWNETETIAKPLEKVFVLVNEETRAPVANPVARVLSEGTVVGLANHTVLISRDNTEYPIADCGAPIRDEKGAITGVVLVFRDQTRERAAQKMLRESEQRFKTQYQDNPTPTFTWQKKGDDFELIDFNDAAKVITDGKVMEFVGKKASQLYAERPDILRDLQQCLVEKKIIRREITSGHFVPDRFIVITMVFVPPDLVMVHLEDITERKQAEAERLDMERKLLQTQKLESLGILAGGIAHDFNNLLMVVLGNADLALEDLSTVSPAHPMLMEIKKVALRAAELCKQMLAYAGKGAFFIKPIDLSKLVEEMGRMLEISISKKALLRYDLSKKLPAIRADAAQVRQVVMNLIINASEAIGDRGGIISVRTGYLKNDQVDLKEYPFADELAKGPYVFLEVADTGCGMDSATLAKMFDPFFTTKFTGRGLGLPAVLGIVRGHKGALKIDSAPGQGTSFHILFPAVETAAETTDSEWNEKETWKGEGVILLVDDEEPVRSLCRRMLEHIGFEVLTAGDGREALEVFKKHGSRIRCVLLDLTMPYMDGGEAFTELRRLDPGVRVILCSGYNEQTLIHQFFEKGLSGFIQKPYQLNDLKMKLKSVLTG